MIQNHRIAAMRQIARRPGALEISEPFEAQNEIDRTTLKCQHF
jgi:ABC-type proline/glycine betaine transport system ATPase subunit